MKTCQKCHKEWNPEMDFIEDTELLESLDLYIDIDIYCPSCLHNLEHAIITTVREWENEDFNKNKEVGMKVMHVNIGVYLCTKCGFYTQKPLYPKDRVTSDIKCYQCKEKAIYSHTIIDKYPEK